MITAKSGRKYRKIPEGMDVEVWDVMSPLDRLKFLGLIEGLDKPVILVIPDWQDARWLINCAMAAIDESYEKGSVRHDEMKALYTKLQGQLRSQLSVEDFEYNI